MTARRADAELVGEFAQVADPGAKTKGRIMAIVGKFDGALENQPLQKPVNPLASKNWDSNNGCDAKGMFFSKFMGIGGCDE